MQMTVKVGYSLYMMTLSSGIEFQPLYTYGTLMFDVSHGQVLSVLLLEVIRFTKNN